MSDSAEIPFQTLIEALLDQEIPFDPRYLHRFSDLEGEDLELFKDMWSRVLLGRRRALVEDLNELSGADDLLSFENIGRHTIADEDGQVRTYAVQLLWEFEERDLIPVFLDLLENDSVPEVRAAAATGLGLFVYHGEIDRLSKAHLDRIENALITAVKKDHSELVQCRALESLGYSSRGEVAALIEPAFTSGGHEKIASALIAMGRSMDPRWEKIILQMLNSKIPTLRAEAARAAGELEIKDSIPLLVELTDDSEHAVRSAAIWSLSEIGGDQARHTLENLFRETEDDHEADLIESALDNIAFTDGMQPFSLFDFPEENPEDELLEMLISQDDSQAYDEMDEVGSDMIDQNGDETDTLAEDEG